MPVIITLSVNETNLIDKLKDMVVANDCKTFEDLYSELELSNPSITYSSKKNKSKVKKTSQEKVKRKTNGFLVFSNENRKKIEDDAKSKLGDGEKYKQNETMKTLGSMWSNLTSEEQLVWKNKANEMNSDDKTNSEVNDKKPVVTKTEVNDKKPVVTKKEKKTSK